MIRAAAILALVSAAAPAAADPVLRLAVDGQGFNVSPDQILQVEAEEVFPGAVVFFRFAEAPSYSLEQLTAASIGLKLDMIVCGHVLMSPVVMEVIKGGVGQINMGDITAARELAATLHGDRACADYRGS
ncbi:SecDF P1 head subdomain-containing protein [Oceanibium sediminis]|uniref:SecDF P1 head subdomain-containing protein n=1 Tax=Oceanibium sediminis TaxID=2026339 RepID=UPI000DD3A71E|nr:hypothetical protein [Oceanibium sediminis]